jgi:hypothetical protein
MLAGCGGRLSGQLRTGVTGNLKDHSLLTITNDDTWVYFDQDQCRVSSSVFDAKKWKTGS